MLKIRSFLQQNERNRFRSRETVREPPPPLKFRGMSLNFRQLLWYITILSKPRLVISWNSAEAFGTPSPIRIPRNLLEFFTIALVDHNSVQTISWNLLEFRGIRLRTSVQLSGIYYM